MSSAGARSRPPAHWSSSSAPRLRLRRLISLASESSGGEDTSARICGPPVGGAPMKGDGFHAIPARLSALPHTALRTARGSRVTAVSRRGAARTPMLPVTTHPPSARDRSARRERRPERVVAVTVTIERDPVRGGLDHADPLAGALARLNGDPDDVLVQGERADERGENPALVPGGPRGGIDRVGGTVRALELERTREPPDAGAGELHRQVIEGGSRAFGALEGGIAVHLDRPAADPFAGDGIHRPDPDYPRGPARGAAQHASGIAGGEQLDRGRRHQRQIGTHAPDHPPRLVGHGDAPLAGC